MDFKIASNKPISEKVKGLNFNTFQEVCLYIQNLAYKRNLNKENIFCVFSDLGGTCSTKHALLKRLAEENNHSEIKLMLGIFRMNAENTPKIKSVLEKYQLKEIPEAHNYLKFENEVLDFTRKNSSAKDFENELLQEIEIQPNQITTFKVDYQKDFIQKHLQKHPEIQYSLDEFWNIREKCILTLQK